MLYNKSMEHRIPRAVSDPTFDLAGKSHDEVVRFICSQDADRAAYRDALTDAAWGVKESYDLCLDSDLLGREKCARFSSPRCATSSSIHSGAPRSSTASMVKWTENHR